MHTGRGKGVISCTPSKDFEKFGHTYAIKQENRFSHNPSTPKNLKMSVHLFSG
jgi:hypothetical protein